MRSGLRLHPDVSLMVVYSDTNYRQILHFRMFPEHSTPEFTSIDYFISSYTQVYLVLLPLPCFKDPPTVFLYSSSVSFTPKFLPETILLFEKTSYKLQVALGTSLW